MNMTFEESLQHEIDAMILLSDLHGWRTIKTPRYARLDGLVLNHDGDMLAVYELKSRELTLDELATMGTYLVTHQKLEDGCDAARVLGVPFVLIVYLIGSENIVSFKIADADGSLLIDYDVARTTTRKNVNGGIVERYNAFIPLKHMRVLK